MQIPGPLNLAPAGIIQRPITRVPWDQRRPVEVRVRYASGVEIRRGTEEAHCATACFVRLHHRPGQPSYGEGGWFRREDVRDRPVEG